MTWAIRCHSERTRTVIPSDTELSFRATPNCHSKRHRTVIPSDTELSFRADPNCHSSDTELSFRAKRSVAEESHRLAPGCRLRFFTPLRSVQNDMTWAIRCHSERTRTVVPSEAELSFRAKRSVAEESPREMLRRRLSMTDAASA